MTAAQQSIADLLQSLGYTPTRQNVRDEIYAWKDRKTGRIIAKTGMRSGTPFRAIKFFGVTDPPARLQAALFSEIEARNGQYCRPVRDLMRKAFCGSCTSCTGGGLGYFCVRRDGTEVVRCGAYPITIPDFSDADVPELIAVLRTQHAYFSSLN